MKLFLDSDVILDVLLGCKSHAAASSRVLALVAQGNSGFVSPHSITIIHYVCLNQFKKEGVKQPEQKARNVISNLLVNLKVATLNDKIVKKGLASPFDDFEDAIAYYCAESVKADLVVTRNINDFPDEVKLPVVLPETLLEMLEN